MYMLKTLYWFRRVMPSVLEKDVRSDMVERATSYSYGEWQNWGLSELRNP